MNKKYNFTKEDYENAAKISFSYAGMCRALEIRPVGGNYTTLKDKIKKYNIDISHFTGQGWNLGLKFKNNYKINLTDILKKDVSYQSNKLKKRLINEGLKEYKCEKCGRTEWEGKEIPLELHHIDGNKYNNELNNLQLLCPNCHAQTEHYRGKNQERYKENKKIIPDLEQKIIYKSLPKKVKKSYYVPKPKKEKPKRYCENCGKELTSKQSRFCSQECAHEFVSKRPPVNELIEKLSELNNNMVAIGKFYGVSDNAVRKWIKLYKL